MNNTKGRCIDMAENIIPRPDWLPAGDQVCYVIGALRGNAEQPRDFYLAVAGRWTTAGSWYPSKQYVETWPENSIAFFRDPDNALAALNHLPSWTNDGGDAPIVRWFPCWGADHIHVDA